MQLQLYIDFTITNSNGQSLQLNKSLSLTSPSSDSIAVPSNVSQSTTSDATQSDLIFAIFSCLISINI